MRTGISILLILIFPLLLNGQTAEDEVIRLKGAGESKVEVSQTVDEPQTVDESHSAGSWNFSVGTSYSYMKGYGSGMMFFAAPTYTMPLSDKWALHGGMIASQYYSSGSIQSGEILLPGSFSSLAMFAAASYRMNDRLVFHGTGVKHLLSAPVTPFTPYPMDNLSLGAIYRLGNNITIGASIHMNNGRGYYSTPFGGHSFQSPFYW
ncbi:MAG: hypothetical protein KAT15_27500 [Bacteroidales bacterium]|nr:hypothetical protein [Bacteroidales bacterium]